MTPNPSWDRKEAQLLRAQGLNQEQIGFVLGRLAEHRMSADLAGYKRGYNQGHADCQRKVENHATQ